MSEDGPDIHAKLKSHFGFDRFRPGQEAVIEALLAGRSAGAIFPTGSGKSLCYQLPALCLPGLTLVISPLLALMKDQIDGLRARGIQAERLDSSLDEDEYRRVMDDIRNARTKLLFVAPERLSNERFLNLIRSQPISLLAIDEAHCISSWGHNFRPDYLKLSRAAKELKVERVLALTATATPQVAQDIAAAFNIQAEDMINTGFYRPNLELAVTVCQDDERTELLMDRLKSRPAGPTIVYVSLQRHAEEVAASLQAAGFDAVAYHAGMAAETRSTTQEAFMAGRIQIICATIAFGMGVDKADIRYVYHYHMAKGFESYMQEIGRAGRDRKSSICELFACPDDCTTLENFVYGDTPDPLSIAGLIDELIDADPIADITVYDLSKRFDMRPLVINTLLTRLELMGVLRSEGHYYGNVRFAPNSDSQTILAEYPEKQAAFIRKIFSCCTMAKKWATLNMEQAVERTGQDRNVVLRALESIETKGFAKLQLAGYRQRFKILQPAINREQLTEDIKATFQEHESMEIKRIHSMLHYAAHDGCLTAKLLEYFGENIEDCGHCSRCQGEAAVPLPKRRHVTLAACDLNGFDALVSQHPNALGRPRQQARFLCGLNSPAVSSIRSLRGHPLFGRCAEVPFAEVLTSR